MKEEKHNTERPDNNHSFSFRGILNGLREESRVLKDVHDDDKDDFNESTFGPTSEMKEERYRVNNNKDDWLGFDVRGKKLLSENAPSSSTSGSKMRGNPRRSRLSQLRASISAASEDQDIAKAPNPSSTQNASKRALSWRPDATDVEGGKHCDGNGSDEEEADYLESSPLHAAEDNDGEPKLERGEEEQEQHIVWAVLQLMKNRSWKKKLLTAIVTTSIILVIVDFIWFGNMKSFLDDFLEWMRLHPVDGCFAFIGMFVLATNIFIPPTILTLGSGYIFVGAYGLGMGIYLATVSCFLGSCIGAFLSFLRARYMMRDLIKLFAKRYPLVRRLDTALKQKGFRIMFLLRLCGVVPFNALNYIGGVTGVTLSSFVASLVGILPQIILTIFIGATAESIYEGRNSEDHKIYQNVLLCLGCAFGAISIVAIWHLASKELNANDEIKEDTSVISERDTLSVASEPNDNGDSDGGEATDEEWYWMWT